MNTKNLMEHALFVTLRHVRNGLKVQDTMPSRFCSSVATVNIFLFSTGPVTQFQWELKRVPYWTAMQISLTSSWAPYIFQLYVTQWKVEGACGTGGTKLYRTVGQVCQYRFAIVKV